MRLITLATLTLFLGGCAIGYASDERALGIAVGQARLAACEAGEDCPEVQGGAISEPFSQVFGRLLGAVTGGGGQLLFLAYGAVLLAYWDGQTAGKYICGLRVVDIFMADQRIYERPM